MIIAVTGHRPQKLWGFNMNDERYLRMAESIKQYLIDNNCTEAIQGMALGVDQIFAQAVLDLKDSGYDIRLVGAIPFEGQESRWRIESQTQFNILRKRCDDICVVGDNYPELSIPALMQKRNEWMVDRADSILAIWNGERSGTGNCVKYARKKKKPVTIWNPSIFE